MMKCKCCFFEFVKNNIQLFEKKNKNFISLHKKTINTHLDHLKF